MSVSISKNPKLIISNYFDSLICQVDIFTEERLAEIDSNSVKDPPSNHRMNDTILYRSDYKIEKTQTLTEYFDDAMDTEAVEQYVNANFWIRMEMGFDYHYRRYQIIKEQPKPMKASDWNDARDELIATLNQMQNETFKHYETIKAELKRDNNNNIVGIMEQVFEKRFLFILKYNNPITRKSMNLIELDFYLNPYECHLLR